MTRYLFNAPRTDSDVELIVKKSRFIGSVRVALSAEEAAEIIKAFPRLYPKANHHCWAYRIGINQTLEHFSDAGEPAGTAGRPILGAIKRHDLYNTLIVVTRYFGGIKLGVRGLIEAYGQAAEMAAAEAGTAEMELRNALEISCGYEHSKTVASALRKLGFGESSQSASYGEDVKVKLEVPCSMRDELALTLGEMAARGLISGIRWDDKPLVREIRSGANS